MKRLLPLVLLFFFPACGNLYKTSSPNNSCRVLAGNEAFIDSSIMLLKHLSRLTPARAWERQVELARINDINDWNAYKEKLLRGYQRSLGLPFPEKSPLKAEKVEVLDRGSYRIENVLYQSMPEIYVTANLYVPQEGDGPFPGILFPCGHSSNGKAYKDYHGAALGLVQKGYVVLVFDPVGQGERCQYLEEDGTPLIGAATVEHSLLANPLFLLGKHLMALRMWDAIRGIDYLLTRDEVDPDRIGCTGCSGGGTVTLHLAPLEPRIKAVVPVGTVGSPDMALGAGSTGDGEQNLTRLVPEGITHADLMMLAYPRPYRLIIESRGGVRRGTWDSFVQARFLYETLGFPERMTFVETEWPHGYFKAMREPMYYWFGKWLYDRKDDSREPELKLEEEINLLCTKSGQILNERGKSIQKWISELVKKNMPEQQVPENQKTFDVFSNDLRSEIKVLLNKPTDNNLPLIRTFETLEDNKITIEKLIIYSEEDIYLPSLFYKAKGAAEKVPTAILIDSQGKTADGGALARKLASCGFGVLALDLRGMGETRSKRNGRDRREGFQAQTLGVDASMAYDGLRLGVSIFAMRVYDLLKATDYLLSRNDVKRQAGIAVIGKSSCGPLALYAATLEKMIKGVLVDSSLASFRELTVPRLYLYNFIDFLPGVLSRHDLPQVAGSLAPGQVWILNALDSQKNLKAKTLLEDDYRFSRDCYRVLGASDNFQVRTYSTAQERLDNYLEWINKVLSGK